MNKKTCTVKHISKNINGEVAKVCIKLVEAKLIDVILQGNVNFYQ